MRRRDIIRLVGTAVTGLGMVFVPLSHNKYLIALDWILFAYFTFSLVCQRAKDSEIGFEDFNDSLDNKFSKNLEEKNYKKATLYLAVKPVMAISLLWVVGFVIVFLLNN